MVRRARKGESVMKLDRDHLHQIFLSAELTDRQALVAITLFSLVMAGFVITGELFAVPEWIMFVLFLAVFVAYERALGMSGNWWCCFGARQSNNVGLISAPPRLILVHPGN